MEVGWHLHPDAEGHGYATEAARAVIDRGCRLGLPEVFALVVPDNVRSQRVCRRLGMTHVGGTIQYHDTEYGGRWCVERAGANGEQQVQVGEFHLATGESVYRRESARNHSHFVGPDRAGRQGSVGSRRGWVIGPGGAVPVEVTAGPAALVGCLPKVFQIVPGQAQGGADEPHRLWGGAADPTPLHVTTARDPRKVPSPSSFQRPAAAQYLDTIWGGIPLYVRSRVRFSFLCGSVVTDHDGVITVSRPGRTA